MSDSNTTYTGHVIYNVEDIRPEQINIIDIAHALSGAKRWAAQRWITIAEHSIMVMNLVKKYDDRFAQAPPMRVFGALMHDAEEAYLGDMISGLKIKFPEFIRLGKELQVKIEDRFNIELSEEDHKVIKKCDLAARDIEMRMTKFMDNNTAKIAFLEEFLRHRGGTR